MSDFPFHVVEHKIPAQHIREYPRATANSQEDTLYLAVKQYTPKDNPSPRHGDVTVIGAHANGFPKELYEPLWEDLYAASKAQGFRIRNIWIADVSNQGYSGRLNEETLGDEPSWADNSRDVLQMVNVFRDQMIRPIVAIGHSFGANHLTGCALLHPRLFTTMVLFDPTIVSFGFQQVGPGISPAKGSATRREVWPSAAAAAEGFKKSRFYSSWDPRVLDAWIKHGIRPTPSLLFPDAKPGSVTLSTTKHQELFTFFRPLWPYLDKDGHLDLSKVPDFNPNSHQTWVPGKSFPFYRPEGSSVLERLGEVRPSVLFVVGETSDLSTPDKRKLRLEACGSAPGGSGGVQAGRVSEVLMKNRGHLFPMEIPKECATHAAMWIGKEVDRWKNEEDQAYQAWVKHSLREKSTMSEDWMRHVGAAPSQRTEKDSKL